jgi:four helix bundle protein
MEEMILEQKVFDMLDYAYPALQQFPKSEKFALAADIKRSMDTILTRVIEAKKKYYKKTTLQELDVEVAKLKVYIRLAHRQGFLPHKKYEIWSSQVVEIGKMVGGWIKTQSQTPTNKK